MAKGLIYLIDGSGFIFRAFHALPPLVRKDHTPVGAVYGFCTMLTKLLTMSQDHLLLVVFDAGRKTFRSDIYPAYKANRLETPQDLIPQFSLCRQACEAFGIPLVELENFEADDLIASYVQKACEENFKVVIVSSDKDLLQLLTPQVSVFDPLKNKPLTEVDATLKFGVEPTKIPWVQALAGDSSDNVPGVPGIGIKTAAELINEFGDLETVLKKASTIKQPKRREALQYYADQARLSLRLVTLESNAPLPLPVQDIKPVSLDPSKRDRFLYDQGFISLVERLNRGCTEVAQKRWFSTETITTLDRLQYFINKAREHGAIAFDCETTSLHIMEARLVGIALAVEDEAAYLPNISRNLDCHVAYAPRNDEPSSRAKRGDPALNPWFLSSGSCLLELLQDPKVLKIGHNIKYDLGIMGVPAVNVGDSMVLSYVLDAGLHGHSLDELAERHFNYRTTKYNDVVPKGKTFDQVPIDIATAYAAEDAAVTWRLYHHLKPLLEKEGLFDFYQTIEQPMIPVIVQMEANGVLIDPSVLKDVGVEFDDRLAVLANTIYTQAGEVFNIASPKQLGTILFEKLKYPPPKKTKTGGYATDAQTLETLSLKGHPLAQLLLDWKSLSKLRSTYVDGLIESISPKTGRVHTSFSMVGTTTGRLSSSDPNLQNIPIKTIDGRKIREAFIASPGYQLVSLDYSQIELRLLAHFADVPTLQEAFLKGHDIHQNTAAEIFNTPLDQVTTEQRRRAKAINFGIIYGISSFGLGVQLGVSPKEAALIIESYFLKYPGIQTYMEQQKEKAQSLGYVETLWGRRCHTPGIHDKNPMVRQFSERQAINAPLQGSSADIIKKAMIQIHDLLSLRGAKRRSNPGNFKKTGLPRPFQGLAMTNERSRMVLQIHDELLFEVPLKDLSTTPGTLKRMMETVISLKVPLVVDVGIGATWNKV